MLYLKKYKQLKKEFERHVWFITGCVLLLPFYSTIVVYLHSFKEPPKPDIAYIVAALPIIFKIYNFTMDGLLGGLLYNILTSEVPPPPPKLCIDDTSFLKYISYR